MKKIMIFLILLIAFISLQEKEVLEKKQASKAKMIKKVLLENKEIEKEIKNKIKRIEEKDHNEKMIQASTEVLGKKLDSKVNLIEDLTRELNTYKPSQVPENLKSEYDKAKKEAIELNKKYQQSVKKALIALSIKGEMR